LRQLQRQQQRQQRQQEQQQYYERELSPSAGLVLEGHRVPFRPATATGSTVDSRQHHSSTICILRILGIFREKKSAIFIVILERVTNFIIFTLLNFRTFLQDANQNFADFLSFRGNFIGSQSRRKSTVPSSRKCNIDISQ